MTLHCAEIKGYNNIALLQDAFAGEAKYVPHCTCRDAGATVQRSRKVATISHEYVTAWMPAQERQGRYRIAQGCRIYCAEIEKGRY